jgi:hypothetical protein
MASLRPNSSACITKCSKLPLPRHELDVTLARFAQAIPADRCQLWVWRHGEHRAHSLHERIAERRVVERGQRPVVASTLRHTAVAALTTPAIDGLMAADAGDIGIGGQALHVIADALHGLPLLVGALLLAQQADAVYQN